MLVKTPVLKTTPRATPLRSCRPHIHRLQPQMKVLLRRQVSDRSHFSAPASPRGSPDQCLRSLAALGATRQKGPSVRDSVNPERAVHATQCPDSSSQRSFCSCAGRREGGECASRRTAKEPVWREVPRGICLAQAAPRDCAAPRAHTAPRMVSHA